MLNPHFVAWEQGLFGGHKSEDIRTFFFRQWYQPEKNLIILEPYNLLKL